MDDLWPLPGQAAAEAIRAVSQRVLADIDGFIDMLAAPARLAQNAPALESDASLMEEDLELDRSELLQWLTSNIQHPGRRVEPYVGQRTSEYLVDLASRGIRPDFAAGWRAALGVGWRRWVEECLSLDLDAAVLADVLDVSAHALVQYAMDSIRVMQEANLQAAGGRTDADAVAMIQLIASGAAVARDLAEGRLNYRLARQHLALVIWAEEPGQDASLDALIAQLRALVEPRCALVARGSSTSRWIWLSGNAIPDRHAIERTVRSWAGGHATMGRPGSGLDGFSASHQDALAAQAMIVRLGSRQQFTSYADVELIDALTKDRASARRFVRKTLGPLVDGDEVLREALLAYVQSGFSTTQTAANLYAHRNTVERRVSRANELSAVKVEDNPTYVAAALMVLALAPDIVSD